MVDLNFDKVVFGFPTVKLLYFFLLMLVFCGRYFETIYIPEKPFILQKTH